MYHPSYPFESLGLNSFMYAGPSDESSTASRSSIIDISEHITLTPTALSEDVDQYYKQQLSEQPSSCIHPFDISLDISTVFDDTFFPTPLDHSSSAFMTPSSSSSSSSPSPSPSPSPKNDYYSYSHYQQHHNSSYHQDFMDFPTPYRFETPTPPSMEMICFEMDIEDEQIENEDNDDSDEDYMEEQSLAQFEDENCEDDLDMEYESDDHVYMKLPHDSPIPSSPKPTIKKAVTCNKSKKKRTDDLNTTADVTRCTRCDTQNTPLWRRNMEGLPLCNACGLFLKLHGTARPLSLKTDVIKKRNRSGNGSLSSSTSKRKRSLRATRKGSKKRS
ncbi:unnamed protein product [Absidia cylindrospora]